MGSPLQAPSSTRGGWTLGRSAAQTGAEPAYVPSLGDISRPRGSRLTAAHPLQSGAEQYLLPGLLHILDVDLPSLPKSLGQEMKEFPSIPARSHTISPLTKGGPWPQRKRDSEPRTRRPSALPSGTAPRSCESGRTEGGLCTAHVRSSLEDTCSAIGAVGVKHNLHFEPTPLSGAGPRRLEIVGVGTKGWKEQ